jgi:chromate transporter
VLRELAWVFLKLGSTAFGGPAAHVALMEEEFVRRRGWLTHAEFLDLHGATNLIPGPNSTELAILIGLRRAGWRGLLVAGVCFIAPAALVVLGFAVAYERYGRLPQALGLLYGIKPVVIAVVAQALVWLLRKAIKGPALAVLGIVAAVMVLGGANEVIVLFAAGGVMAAVTGGFAHRAAWAALTPLTLGSTAPAAIAASSVTAVPVSLAGVFLFFLKVGAVLFGSGYVLLAFLQGELVDRWGWLTRNQLLDAVAVGQFTPGPLLTTATFIGYLLSGVPGALVATVGIFLPAFVLVAVSGPLIPRLRESKRAGAFLDGVNVAALALMAVVAFRLGASTFVDVTSIVLAILAALLLMVFRVNSAWLVAGGGIVGVLLRGG